MSKSTNPETQAINERFNKFQAQIEANMSLVLEQIIRRPWLILEQDLFDIQVKISLDEKPEIKISVGKKEEE
jgi:hypothetical protein